LLVKRNAAQRYQTATGGGCVNVAANPWHAARRTRRIPAKPARQAIAVYGGGVAALTARSQGDETPTDGIDLGRYCYWAWW